jgi:hypothetical protein
MWREGLPVLVRRVLRLSRSLAVDDGFRGTVRTPTSRVSTQMLPEYGFSATGQLRLDSWFVCSRNPYGISPQQRPVPNRM